MTEFFWRARVYWEDTDGGGVVFYANYLKYMERARTEWLRSQGHAQSELAEKFGFVFAVVEVKLQLSQSRATRRRTHDFLPARAGRPRIRCSFQQVIKRGDTVLVEGEVRVACVDAKTFRPRRLPRFHTSVEPRMKNGK